MVWRLPLVWLKLIGSTLACARLAKSDNAKAIRHFSNAVLNTRWTQFINQRNYKTIYSNVLDCAYLTKIHTPSSAKRYLPLTTMHCTKIIPRPGMASYRESLLTSRPLLETLLYCCSLPNARDSMPFRAIRVVLVTLLSELYVMRGSLSIFRQSKARRALYFGITVTTRASSE